MNSDIFEAVGCTRNPMFCESCGGPAIINYQTLRGICPRCHAPDPTAYPCHYPAGAVCDLLIAWCFKHGSQKAAAVKLGISPAYLSDVINRKRDISAALAKRLGLRRVVSYIIELKEDA